MSDSRQGDTTPRALAAVLLAAGSASRMGYRPKCLLELDGVALIRRQVLALKDAGVGELVVVLGHYADAIAPLLHQLPVHVVRNPAPEQGQVSSQRLGLASLRSQPDAVLMALADQPLIEAADIRQVIQHYHLRPPGAQMVFPRVGDQPGNPVMISEAARKAVLASADDVGCRQWRQQHKAAVYAFDSDNRHFITDVDTQADMAAFTQQTGRVLHWPVPKPA